MSPRPLTGAGVQELVVHERVLINIADLETDRRVADYSRAFYRRFRLRSGLWVPMLRDTEVIGIVIVWHTEPSAFGPRHEELLKTFADQAVIAIENVRLFTELEEKNRALTQAHTPVSEALDQQTATAEILGVISSSPTDVAPVLSAIAERAARLCQSWDAVVLLETDGYLAPHAHYGPVPLVAILPGRPPGWLPISRETVTG